MKICYARHTVDRPGVLFFKYLKGAHIETWVNGEHICSGFTLVTWASKVSFEPHWYKGCSENVKPAFRLANRALRLKICFGWRTFYKNECKKRWKHCRGDSWLFTLPDAPLKTAPSPKHFKLIVHITKKRSQTNSVSIGAPLIQSLGLYCISQFGAKVHIKQRYL